MRHITSLGRSVVGMGENATNQAESCTFELNSFITRNKGTKAFPTTQVEFQPYQMSEDLQRYKNFLVE